VRKAARIGFPVTRVRSAGNQLADAEKVTKIRSVKRPRIRLVSPGKTFCSAIAVRMPSRRAARTAGPEAYPPTPTTTAG
jgi:hypothetical protein